MTSAITADFAYSNWCVESLSENTSCHSWGRDIKQKDTFRTDLLNEALRELKQAVLEAEKEEDLSSLSQTTIETARTVLSKAYSIFPHLYEIYPIENGGISIETPMGKGGSIWFICYADGGIDCRLNIKDKPYRKERLESVKKFPSDFVREALTELSSYLT